MLDHIAAQVVADPVGVPAGLVQQPLHAVRAGLPGLLGQLPAVLAFGAAEQAPQEGAHPAAGLHPLEARRDPLGQLIQLGGPALDLGHSDVHVHLSTSHPTTTKRTRYPNQTAAVVLSDGGLIAMLTCGFPARWSPETAQ